MKILAAALIAVVLWGASPVAAKIAVSSLSPMTVAILRTIIGGLVALPLAMSTTRSSARPFYALVRTASFSVCAFPFATF